MTTFHRSLAAHMLNAEPRDDLRAAHGIISGTIIGLSCYALLAVLIWAICVTLP